MQGKRAERDTLDALLVRVGVRRCVQKNSGDVLLEDLPELLQCFGPLLLVMCAADGFQERIRLERCVPGEVIRIAAKVISLARELLNAAAVPVREAVQVIQEGLSEKKDVVIATEETLLEFLFGLGHFHAHVHAQGRPLFPKNLRNLFVLSRRGARKKREREKIAVIVMTHAHGVRRRSHSEHPFLLEEILSYDEQTSEL